MSPTPEQIAQARSTTANAVWNTADRYLRSVVEPEEYGDYIIPFAVLRRIECMLDAKREAFNELYSRMSQGGTKDINPRMLSLRASHELQLSFYNTFPLDLKAIGSNDDNVDVALKSYIDSFSDNLTDIWRAFKFHDKIDTLHAAGRLFGVVQHFAGIDMHPDLLPDTAMGDMFEDIMYRAFNTKGKSAGAFYTPRDAISLMVDILFSSDDEGLSGKSPSRTIYDPCAGTGGMLLVAKNELQAFNRNAQVSLHGQELMDFAYGIGKADLIMLGNKPESILQGDTLVNDRFEGQTFDYILTNPPYGSDWSAVYDDVTREASREGSRFSHGLPAKSDGQMLFLSHVVHKLTNPHGETGGGRAGIVLNGSPLFTGAPESGPDRIRAWLLTDDLVDAIIALPTSMFYGTGIATYIWILDKNKEPHRRGKIQLINAADQWSPMRKGMGDKRRKLSPKDREIITKEYAAFEDSDISKIVTADDLGFKDVPVYRQERYITVFSDEAVEQARAHKSFTDAHVEVMREADGMTWNDLPDLLKTKAKVRGLKMPVGLIAKIMQAMAVHDDAAPAAVDHKGNPVSVAGWKMTERIPLTEDVDEHMRREVLPFAPDVTWDENAAKIGYEIPFTRLFYVPEEVRPLAEIDADVQRVMGELMDMFQEVKR
ncbi:N-6 DNA methylase [Corynebacterium hindlerae]|uniref:class I SAM-dependent DNA methyltransferase n=1 Tax=Corynebacterium hindlerae TaxID=699041 RepID=UPI0031B70FFD